MPADKPKILNQEDGPKRFVDEETDKRNYEHITNENDQITHEDIANIKTDVTEMSDSQPSASELPDESQLPDESEEDDDNESDDPKDEKDRGMETPWNILGS